MLLSPFLILSYSEVNNQDWKVISKEEIANQQKLNKIKEELEDRFGKLDNNMIIYMNEELFESYLRKLEGKIFINNDLFIEIIFSKEISEKLNYEDLIVTSLNISKDIIFSYKPK